MFLILLFVVYFMVELGDEVVEDFLLDVTHLEFLLGILADFGYPGTTGADIVLTDALHGLLRQFVNLVIVENHLVGPCPLVFTVVAVDVVETIQHLLNALDASTLDIVDEPLFLTGRQQQSREVVPFTFAHGGGRLAEESFLDGTLQHGTHIDAEGDVVILDALAQ